MQVRANGLTFNCRIEGTAGAPWVVLSHSILTDLSMWDRQARRLAPHFQVMRYDTRGHGDSEAPAAPYRMEDLARDAVALMDALNIGQAHYVGLSLGGMTAIGLALDHADRLLSAAICDARADMPPEAGGVWDERIATVETAGTAALAEATVQRWFLPASLAAEIPALDPVRRMIARTSPAGFIGCARALQGLDYLPRLREIRVPTLLLAGEQDGPIPELNRAMQAMIPAARAAVIPGAGHIANLEQPEAFDDALFAFLDAVGEGSSRA